MRNIILASHGEFSKGLKDSVSMIVGDLADPIRTYSLYPSCSPADYMEEMTKEILAHPEDEYVFLCDAKGGSVHSAVSRLCSHRNVVVYSGTNMNLVLDLLLSTPESLSGNTETQDRLIASGKDGIEVLDHSRLEAGEEEDF